MTLLLDLDPTARAAGLRFQHAIFCREGYDGHRRHSGLTSMHRLALRRARRVWRQRLSLACAGGGRSLSPAETRAFVGISPTKPV